MEFRDYLQEAAEAYGLCLTERMVEQFTLYYELLLE